MLLKATVENNPEMLSEKYEQQTRELERKVEEIREETHRAELDLRNMHIVQKPLEEVDA